MQRELEAAEMCVIGHLVSTSQFILALHIIRPYLYNFPQNKLLLCDNILSRSLRLTVAGINFVRFLLFVGNFAELECITMEIKVKEKSLRRLKI